jgi:hypothetical protein
MSWQSLGPQCYVGGKRGGTCPWAGTRRPPSKPGRGGFPGLQGLRAGHLLESAETAIFAKNSKRAGRGALPAPRPACLSRRSADPFADVDDKVLHVGDDVPHAETLPRSLSLLTANSEISTE